MATMPPSMAADMTAAPEEAASGYCIQLCVMADGTFEVSKGPLPAEETPTGEPGGGPEAAEGEKTADNIGDALKLVLDIFEADGQAGAEEEFNAGFGAGPKGKAPAKPGMTMDGM